MLLLLSLMLLSLMQLLRQPPSPFALPGLGMDDDAALAARVAIIIYMVLLKTL
jgi:hypothetical protein